MCLLSLTANQMSALCYGVKRGLYSMRSVCILVGISSSFQFFGCLIMLASSWLETAGENGVQGSSLGHHPGHSKASFQQKAKDSTCPHPRLVTYLSCIILRSGIATLWCAEPSLTYLHGQRVKPRTSCSDALPSCAFQNTVCCETASAQVIWHWISWL